MNAGWPSRRRIPSVIAAFLVILLAAAAAWALDPLPWVQVGPPADVVAVAVGPSQPAPPQPGVIYAAVALAGIYRSADGGATWNLGLGSPRGATQIVAPAQTPGTAYTFSLDEGLFKTTDGGISWVPVFSGPCYVTGFAVAPSQPNLVYVFNQFIDISPTPPCDEQGGISSSSDGGASFTGVVGTRFGPFAAIAVEPADPRHIYAVSLATSTVYSSTDGGLTLISLAPNPGPDVTRIVVDGSTTPSTLMVTVSSEDGFGQTFFRGQPSAGGSVTWNAPVSGLPQNLQATDIALDPNLPGTVYLASNMGVYVSHDHGTTWTAQNAGLSSLAVAAVAVDPTLLGPVWAATGTGLDMLGRGGCRATVGGATACLNDARFQTQVTYALGGQTAAATAVQLSDDTTAFWFVDPLSYELLVKVLDGRPVNGDFWVFSGGLSSIDYTLSVTDVVTGAVKTYPKAAGALQSFADTSAFSGTSPSAPPLPPPPAPSARSAPSAPLAPLAPSLRSAPPPAARAGTTSPRAAGACSVDATDLCLASSRFQVAISWQGGSLSGDGQSVPLTDDTGSFWFLAADNFELTVKVLDGTAVNGHFWVFYGAMTDFAFTLTVTDTTTGAVRTFHNAAGNIASAADTSAF